MQSAAFAATTLSAALPLLSPSMSVSVERVQTPVTQVTPLVRMPLVFEHDGTLWKPLPACASTFDDLVCAQKRWLEIFRETRWNSWRTDELAAEQERDRDVMQEWARAEADHRHLTNRALGARMGAITRKHRARFKADQSRWEREKERYVPEREKARFALLELESIRASQTRELGTYRCGEHYLAPE